MYGLGLRCIRDSRDISLIMHASIGNRDCMAIMQGCIGFRNPEVSLFVLLMSFWDITLLTFEVPDTQAQTPRLPTPNNKYTLETVHIRGRIVCGVFRCLAE